VAEQALPVWFGAAFPFFFVGMWIFVCKILSRTGGWQRLAQAYGPNGVPVQGTRFRFRSGAFGSVNYSSVLMLEAGVQGLAFEVFLPFRVAHPPFSVPWSDISFASRNRWFMPTIELSFTRSPGVAVAIPRRLAESLAAAGGVSHRVPPAG
jgi:hypothetical protein